MKPARPRTHRDPGRQRLVERDKALGRLSRLTTATAVAGAAATVAFGGLAAITYTGTTNAAANTVQQPDAEQQGLQGDDLQPQLFGDDETAEQQSLPTLPPTTSQRQPTIIQPPIQTSRHSHVSSGGSG